MVPDEAEKTRRFVVGLGNPTPEYEQTRHNVGFLVLDALRQRWMLPRPDKRFSARVADARVTRGDDEKRVLLMWPQTYMNRSGRAVQPMLGFYKARPEHCLVVLDDMALPLGRLRGRAGGSPGGHNGLADVVRALGTRDVPRLRIGIGAPPDARMDSVDYVLGRFRPEELDVIRGAVQRAADAVEDWVFHDIRTVMDRYNAAPSEEI